MLRVQKVLKGALRHCLSAMRAAQEQEQSSIAPSARGKWL